jgi:hypothetical protein
MKAEIEIVCVSEMQEDEADEDEVYELPLVLYLRRKMGEFLD